MSDKGGEREMAAETVKTGGTLMDLEPGQSGVILKVGSDKGPVKRRLVDMGLTPGTLVTVRKVADRGDHQPGGDRPAASGAQPTAAGGPAVPG